MKISRSHILQSPPQLDRRAPVQHEGARLKQFLLSTHKGGVVCDCDLCNALDYLFTLKERKANERGRIEKFIRECFATAYGARVYSFMPRLFELTTRRGELVAAFGARPAQAGQLFLETYMDAAIEQEIEDATGEKPRREHIVEVGNLAAIYPGAVRWMIIALTVRLYDEGYEWVVFTGTATLRNAFHKLGLRPVVIGPARPERLSADDRAQWGTYYDNQPMVMAGNIRYGLNAMKSNPELVRLAEEQGKSDDLLHQTSTSRNLHGAAEK
ncbi:MAG: thermostable hemolysin [Gallionellaceae bacterium]|nr:thermostable hemolysin [Gallionellaceae bacterium]